MPAEACPLCDPVGAVLRNALAYARPDDHPLGPGHFIVVPFRHVADFFAMTAEEKRAVFQLLDQARERVAKELAPDGYNIGAAAGQSRMHVHVHLIPRFRGDVADPRGGVRCVLARQSG